MSERRSQPTQFAQKDGVRPVFMLSAEAREDWELALTHRFNVLVVGPTAETQRLIEIARARLLQPLVTLDAPRLRMLPDPHRTGTVVLQDPWTLNHSDHQRVFDWLDEAAGRVQVITTSPREIFPLMRAGRFPEPLFYRLNVVRVRVSAPGH